MPRTNQIPFLTPSSRTPGATYHWKPSPRLRRYGFQNQRLGTDWGTACAAAIVRNEEVTRWLREHECGENGPSTRVAPRILRWFDLVAAYKADPAYLDLKPKSRAEYDSRLRTLETWAIDGTLRLDDLDRDLVVAFRNALVKDPRKHRTAALLRVLRILANFGASQGWLPPGIANSIDIPEVRARSTVIAPSDVERLARNAGDDVLALAIRLGFWTFQRESDLLGLSRFNWRPIKDASPFARRLLGGNGDVMGLRLQQNKTDAWVHVPLPPPLRMAVDERLSALEASDGLLLGRGAAGAPWPAWAFQRAFRRLCAAEGLPHVQFRDLRRSGMVYGGELGVEIQFLTARSGHTVLGHKRTILDTYMPGNSRSTAEGVAIQWQRHLERIEQEKEQAQ